MIQEQNDLFSIWEVSEKLKVPKHTLRFWEKELNGFIVPQRTRGGHRRYTVANVAVLAEIKRQRDNGVGLTEIMKNIRQGREGGYGPSSEIDLLASRVAEVVKKEVYNFFRTEREDGVSPGNADRAAQRNSAKTEKTSTLGEAAFGD